MQLTTDIHGLPTEHSDAGTIKSMSHEIRIDDALNAANFIEAVEHKIVSASNLGDRFTEIRMDQYVRNAEGERVWCKDIIESIHVVFLDEEGNEIDKLTRNGAIPKRITGYIHPHTEEKICVSRVWGNAVFSLLSNLGERMFDVYYLHYIICEDRGGLRQREIMYSSPQSERNIVDYLLSIWKSPLPPCALNVIRAAKWARGIEYPEW